MSGAGEKVVDSAAPKAAKRLRRPRQSFIVLVKTSDITFKVYGPYRSFKRADGDAKAFEGSVEPVLKPGEAD
jgi:hypothetical protein